MKAIGYRVLLEYNSIYDSDPDFQRAKKAGVVLPEEHEEMQILLSYSSCPSCASWKIFQESKSEE